MVNAAGSNPYLANLFAQLGMPSQLIMAQAEQLQPFALQGLNNAYTAALGQAALLQGGGQLPPFLAMPSPSLMQSLMAPIAGAGYGGRERIDLAKMGGADVGDGWFARHFDPRRQEAMRVERVLQNNPMARAAFEAAVGGRVIDDGKNDGKITIERNGQIPYFPGAALNPAALSAFSVLQGQESALTSNLAAMGLGGAALGLGAGALSGSPFLGLVLGGLGGLATGALTGGASGNGGLFGLGNIMPGGFGVGSWNPNAIPGRIGNTNPAYEQAHTAQINGVMNDPSLSVEDKIMLCLMLIMKKMDQDIENQMQYINQLQNQQANRQKKGKALGAIGTIAGGLIGGPIGAGVGGKIGGAAGGGGNSAPSVDIETKKLERMITKRAQMFDMLSNIMKKYDETAKNTIQQIR
ncbi:MAG: hypothetical protein U1E65_26840 [Myxococcota bacterium]